MSSAELLKQRGSWAWSCLWHGAMAVGLHRHWGEPDVGLVAVLLGVSSLLCLLIVFCLTLQAAHAAGKEDATPETTVIRAAFAIDADGHWSCYGCSDLEDVDSMEGALENLTTSGARIENGWVEHRVAVPARLFTKNVG